MCFVNPNAHYHIKWICLNSRTDGRSVCTENCNSLKPLTLLIGQDEYGDACGVDHIDCDWRLYKREHPNVPVPSSTASLLDALCKSQKEKKLIHVRCPESFKNLTTDAKTQFFRGFEQDMFRTFLSNFYFPDDADKVTRKAIADALRPWNPLACREMPSAAAGPRLKNSDRYISTGFVMPRIPSSPLSSRRPSISDLSEDRSTPVKPPSQSPGKSVTSRTSNDKLRSRGSSMDGWSVISQSPSCSNLPNPAMSTNSGASQGTTQELLRPTQSQAKPQSRFSRIREFTRRFKHPEGEMASLT